MKAIIKYPRSIFLIIATEFCERFSFCGLRTILSLYLRNILLFHENTSTIIYHVFIMLCYLVPVVGAILADSLIGRFSTIFYFSLIYAVGNTLMSLAATPPVALPPISTTILGLTLIAIGTGGIKPCVAAFGGDQFTLPQQEIRLQEFFSIFYFMINFGGLMGMIITPILRKSVTCFGDESCYALGFGFPAGLMIIALLLFLAGKPLYKIKAPQENILLHCFKCASSAVIGKYKTGKKDVKKDHWLDYAEKKFDEKLVRDMKIVLSIMYTFLPLPIFWSLFDQQGSRWTFQASRMDGEIAGIHIFPDQMQVINPAIVMLLIPLFDKVLYPWMEKRFRTSALHKMAIGGLIAGLAFIASGILEMSLESTYPILPQRGEAHVNIINTLPCDIHLVNPFNKIQVINSTMNHVFRNVVADNSTSYKIIAVVPKLCGVKQLEWPTLELNCLATESQIDTVVLGQIGSELRSFIVDPDDLKKSLSGKPKIRVIFLQGSPTFHSAKITLSSKRGLTDSYYTPEKQLGVSAYMVLDPGRYNYSLSYDDSTKILYEEEIILRLGGVYSLVVMEVDGQITFSKLYTMTLPNTVHMMWLIPQYLLISIGEVMFAIAGLQFSFTQAPKSMKTVTLAGWYVSVAVGNMLVIVITQSKIVKSQANEFFLFAGLILVDMVLFLKMTANYIYAPLEYDGSTILFESSPLLMLEEPNDEFPHLEAWHILD